MRSNYLITEIAKSHDVDLLALNQSQLLEAYYPSKEEGLRDATRVLGESLTGVDFFEFSHSNGERGKRLLAAKSLFSTAPYSVAWFQNDDLAKAISERIAEKRYDLVHFDTVGLAQYRNLVKGVPTVLDHHNIESHMMLRRAAKEKKLLKKLYFYQEGYRLRRYEKQVLSSFNGHITCSEVDRTRLLNVSPDLNAVAIPNSIQLDPGFSSVSKAASDTQKLLFVGGLGWYPNRDAVMHFLRDIWPGLLRAVPNAEMDIVGKNPSPELIVLAKRTSKVRVHGFVDDITTFYRQASVFVCPIRDGGGTKLKVLDAMAHCLPVVGFPEAWEGIDFVDGQDGVMAETSDVFTSSVARLLADKNAATQMGRNAHKLVSEKYEAKKVGEKLSEYYLALAGDKLASADSLPRRVERVG